MIALLIVTGLKAQKIAVQKEIVKPKADTLDKSNVGQQDNKAISKKDAKVAPTIKYAPSSKVAPIATKTAKIAPAN